MTKKIIMLGMIVLLSLALSANVLAADGSEPAILLAGAGIGAAAHIDGGNVYLPLRAVSEALGCEVRWMEMDRTISVTGPWKNIIFDLDNNKISANDHDYYMSGNCQLIGDRMYISTDFFSDCFGLIADWDRETGVVRLESLENTGLSGEDKLYRASNEAGIQLLKKIAAAEEGENTIFSPVSLSTMLAVLADGAAGKTLAEISAIINPEQLPTDKLNEKCRDLINTLTSSGYEQNGKKTTLVELANSLWIQENLQVKDGFLKDANIYYGAGAYNVNFADDSVALAINRWIEDKTHNKIQNYLSEVDPLTAMMAFSSLYFNGKWQAPFDKSQTQKEIFHLDGGSTAKVDMMNAERRIGYYENDQIQAGNFNYYGCNMLVILPKSNAGAYLSGMNYTDIEQVLHNLEYLKVKIKFPKFDFKQKSNLISHLKKMGMVDAFDSWSADFTGIADRSEGFNLYISDISQECTINVDEEGTEAAALTSVAMAGSAPFKENTPPEFYMNKPFIFVINDERTGLILFIGKVENPSEQG